MVLSLVISAIAIYCIYKILLLCGTVATTPLITAANILYGIYHPPNFPISYYVFGNGLLSILVFPFEYTVWIIYKVIAFIVMLPFHCLAFVINLLLSAFSLFNTVVLSMVVLKIVLSLVSVYYFRNLVFKYVPLDLSDLSLSKIGSFLTVWN